MAEYDDLEGIIEEQLAQQHQSIREMKNSIDSFRAETSRHFDEIMRKSDLIMDLLRGMSNDIRLSSPSENGSEFSIMNLQLNSTNGDVASCDEGSEIEVQQVETFISTTPIAGISAASTYTARFEETRPLQASVGVNWGTNSPTDDIGVDGKKILTESEVCSDVGSVFDELNESSPAVLLKAPVIEPCARYLFDELPRPFLVEQCDKNAGNVDKEADVLPFVDLRSILSSGYEATVNGSINGSTKAWFEEVTSIIEDDAYKVFDEMTQTIRAVLLNEQVTDLYTNDVNFNKLILFDPGGGRKSVVSFSRVVSHPLIGKGLKGVVSSPRHANSFMDTGERHCLTCSNYFYIVNSCSHTTFTLKVESEILHLRGGLPLSTDILDTIRNFYHVQRVTCKVLVRDLSWYDRDDYIGWVWSAMDRGLYIILEGIKDSPYYVLSICSKA